MANFRSYTATQVIYTALRHLGVLLPGQKASPDLNADCLSVLNDMIDAWNIDGLKLPATPGQQFNLTAGTQYYLIGPTATPQTIGGVQYGALVGPWPTDIVAANIILNTVTPVVRRPVDLLNSEQWASIAVQAIPFAIPLKLWYVRDFTASSPTGLVTGLGTINLWPGPLSSYQLELFTPANIVNMLGFVDLVTAYAFPAGYAEPVIFSLAEKIAMLSYTNLKLPLPIAAQNLAEVKKQAKMGRDLIESVNAPSVLRRVDSAFRSENAGAWNYSIGEYGVNSR